MYFFPSFCNQLGHYLIHSKHFILLDNTHEILVLHFCYSIPSSSVLFNALVHCRFVWYGLDCNEYGTSRIQEFEWARVNPGEQPLEQLSKLQYMEKNYLSGWASMDSCHCSSGAGVAPNYSVPNILRMHLAKKQMWNMIFGGFAGSPLNSDFNTKKNITGLF